MVAVQSWPGQGRASDETAAMAPVAADPSNDLVLSRDSLMAREDWKRRIEDARKRAEQARRGWRLNAPRRLREPDPPDKIATERVLGDDTLQPGDIVSTDKGLFLFRGRSGPDGQTADVVPMKREVAQRFFKRCATSNRLVLLM